MMRAIVCGLAALAMLGVTGTAWARGGHGGGHGGHHGGHHSGHHGHAGHHRHGPHRHSSHNAHHHAHWANHHRPFSRDWYGHHPRAWGGGWGWGNPWQTASWGNTAEWLGIDAATNPAWGGYGPIGTTIYDTDNEELETPENQFAEGKNLSGDELTNESKTAMEVAERGVPEPAKETAFMPLGVFTLAPENQTESTAIVQLAIAKDGTLRGTYHDLLANTAIPIHGSVNKKTQRVAWRIGPQGKVAFQTAVAVLTEPSGPVSLHYANGQTRQWVLARHEKEPSPNDPEDEDEQSQRPAT